MGESDGIKPPSDAAPKTLGDAAFLRLQARKGGSVASGSHISGGRKVDSARSREAIAAPPVDPSQLETELKDQLMSLAAVFGGEAAKPVVAKAVEKAVETTPARREQIEKPGRKSLPAATKRSEFAPDPIRQRTHFDLRTPAGQGRTAKDATRTAVKRPSGTTARPEQARRRWLPASTRFYDDVPKNAVAPARPLSVLSGDLEADGARGRGLDARTLSIAALVGIAIGFATLTAVTQLGSSDSATELAALAPVPMSAKAPTAQPEGAGVFAENNSAPTKEQDRLLPRTPALRGANAGEGKTEAKAVVPAAPEPVAAPAAKTVVAAKPAAPRRQQPGWELASPLFETPDRPEVLSYAPIEQPAAPRRSTAANATGSVPAGNSGAGSGKINTSVNMRSSPDNDASVVAVLGVGTTVKIEKCDYWCEVVANGKRGFVFRKFVGR